MVGTWQDRNLLKGCVSATIKSAGTGSAEVSPNQRSKDKKKIPKNEG